MSSGQEDYDRLRPLSYPQTDVFLVCYSQVRRATLENVREKWLPEIRHHCADAAVIIIGTKGDLVTSGSTQYQDRIVPEGEAQRLAKEEGCQLLLTSALTQQGLKDVWAAMGRAALASVLLAHPIYTLLCVTNLALSSPFHGRARMALI